jgi:hypothetical protein
MPESQGAKPGCQRSVLASEETIDSTVVNNIKEFLLAALAACWQR